MMKKVLGGAILLVALLWLGGTLFVASRLSSADKARSRQNAEIAALGEKQAAEVAAVEDGPLKEACAGKLTAGDAYGLVEYVVKLPAADRPDLNDARLDGVVSRLTDEEAGYLETLGMDPPRPERAFPFERSMSPDDWTRLLDRAKRVQGHTDRVRYVLITHVSELEPARFSLSGDTFEPGRSRYRTRVVAWPGGETLCQGTGEGRLRQKEVVGHGGSSEDARSAAARKLAAAWGDATVASPLDDLCDAGGKELCFATNLEIDAPDW